MNQKLTNVLMFVLGAGVGSFVTYKFVEKKYKRIADEEIESVVETFKKREAKLKSKKPVETKKVVTETSEKPAAPVTPKSLGYDTAVIEKPKHISIISPDEFGDFSDYETVSLTYYADGVLTDTDDNVIDNTEDFVGKGFEMHFGEYEDDSVFVRNDDKRVDYEILRDNRTYREVVLGEQT